LSKTQPAASVYHLFHPKSLSKNVEEIAMVPSELSADMAAGMVALINSDAAIAELAWKEHPKFQGVFLKHLIQGAVSAGQLSCHLVRLNPHCALETHIHEKQWELHQVVAGEGDCLLNEKSITYKSGCLALIPPGAKHRVAAGDQGLLLLATFSPALL
jgi:quercetin dioxygenase-like cupin family protein